MPAIKIESEAHWHALRARHCGGTEVPVLFGESRYLTPFALHHRKKGNLPEPDLSGNERVFWGSILQNAIIEGVRQKTGWVVRRMHRYYSELPELGLGGTPDAEIVGHPKGPAVLEIKTIDGLQARRLEGTVPIAWEIQLQTYLALTGRDWGAIAALVGGNELRLYEYEARPKTIELIRWRVAEFWASIEADKPPPPDWEADGDVIAALYRDAVPGKVVDLTDSNRLPALLEQYDAAAAQRRQWERVAKGMRAEILMSLGDAELALCGEWTVRASTVAGVPDRVVDEDMLGETLKGRSGYRGLHLSKRRGEEAA